MPFFDLLRLAFRNLREAKLRATLTSMGVIVGVAVIVTMVSFGLGLQRNMLSRFRALDLFNEMRVFGKNVFAMASAGGNQNSARRGENPNDRRGPSFKPDKEPTRILDERRSTAVVDRLSNRTKNRREFWMMPRSLKSQRFPAWPMSNRACRSLLMFASMVIRRSNPSAALRCRMPVRVK